MKYQNLAELLQSKQDLTAIRITFVEGKESDRFISYRDLYNGALGVLYHLQVKGLEPGDELIFQIHDNEQFLYVFWACILGGIIPIPVSVGNTDEHRLKLFRIWQMLNRPHLIIDEIGLSLLEKCAVDHHLQLPMQMVKAKTLTIETVNETSGKGTIYPSKPDDIAYIQFSSGSTGDPKGVMLTHRNILVNMEAAYIRLEVAETDSAFSWLPLTHNLGLVAFHMIALWGNRPHCLMPTMLFLQQPHLWMMKVQQYQTTILSSPNFGLLHFLRCFKPEMAAGWDLSHVKIILNGAEPVSAEVCKKFLTVLGQYGMKSNVIVPAYGLAESTIAVSIPPITEEIYAHRLDRDTLTIGTLVREIGTDEPAEGNSLSFVDLGLPVDGCAVRICDDTNHVVGEMRIGHIQMKGENVTPGYYHNPEGTEQQQTPDGWFKTGDLGFIKDGRLTVTGRAKEIIFVNGKNFYPQDLERIALELPGLAMREVAVCSVMDDELHKEDIHFFVQHQEDLETFLTLAMDVKKHINQKIGLNVKHVIPVEGMPRTVSGKIQRYKLGEMYKKGTFEPIVTVMEDRLRERYAQREVKASSNPLELRLVTILQDILQLEKIGVDENLLELGANSLKIMNFASRIREECQVELPLSELFQLQTVEELAEYMGQAETSIYDAITPVEKQESYPLTSAQKRLLVLSELEKSGTNYNLPQAMLIEGVLDIPRLEMSFQKLIERHETLRTSFAFVDGQPIQRVHDQVDFHLLVRDGDRSQIEDRIREFIRPFDFGVAPLLRAELIRLAPEQYLFLVDLHHTIADGTSMGVFVRDFVRIYRGEVLPPLRIQYKDYAVWQETFFAEGGLKQQEIYWLDQFAGEIPVLHLPLDYPRPLAQSFIGARERFVASERLTEALEDLAVKTGSTLFMVLLAAYHVFLARYAGQDDIVVGTPVAGRPSHELNHLIGMFVNTLAIRNFPSSNKLFVQFLSEVKENALQAFEHQDYPFERLIDQLEIKRDLSRNPLFDTMFILQNMDLGTLQLDGLQFKPYAFHDGISNFDLTLEAKEADGQLQFEWTYSASLWKAETVQRFSQHFIKILQEVVANPFQPLSAIDLLPEEEKQELIFAYNATQAEYPQDQLLHQLFEAQVDQLPEKTAVVCGEKSLTYGELNTRANQLARRLRALGVGPDQIVAIRTERSLELFIGLLGILKAGAAYLPIDPSYPSERVEFMLQDSKAILLLENGSTMTSRDGNFRTDTSGNGCSAILNKADTVRTTPMILDLADESLYAGEGSNLEPLSTPDNLMYLIYTSGTTGKPKGVMLQHRNVVNYIWWAAKVYVQNEDVDFPLYTSISFDLTVTSIYTPLVTGNTVIVYEGENKELLIEQIIADNRVGVVKLTPSHLKLIRHKNLRNSKIKRLILGGENLETRLAREMTASFGGNVEIYNEYGPTEATVGCMIYRYQPDLDQGFAVPIGRPADNAQIYLLDADQQPVPVGVVGEIYISGDGIARGYMERPELNQEKFLENPFIPAQRMYRTGDLAKRLSSGDIEFLGRLDHQVKIRGNRVELGEIEADLLQHPLIQEAFVMALPQPDGDTDLVAYYVAEQELTVSILREFLRTSLPDYMIPSFFVKVDRIPLTGNGKVDTRALPKPDGQIYTGVEYVAPRDGVEEALVQIWQEILGVERVGVKDHFFELGGHSLKATTLVSKIHQTFDVDLPLREIFQSPTVERLADVIRGAEIKQFQAIEPVAQKADYPVSFAQKRLMVLDQMQGPDLSYNMPGVMLIEGAVQPERFTAAFQQLMQRHETLRTSFTFRGEEPIQIVHEKPDFAVEYHEIGEADLERVISEFVRPFDLNQAPLLRAGLLKVTEERYYFLFDMHHMISDGVSMDILIREFIACYEGRELPELRIQYKDFAVWQNTLFSQGMMQKQEEYWMKRFSDTIPVLNLPTDYPRPTMQSFQGDRIRFNLEGDLIPQIRNLAMETGSTLYMILLAAFHTLLAKYTGQEDVIIGSPVAGRPQEDVRGLIGMFVNTLAIRNYPEGNKSFYQFLAEVKETVLQAVEHQDYPLEVLLEKLKIRRDLSRNPLFDTVFVLQNMDMSELMLDHLRFSNSCYEHKIAKFDLTLLAVEKEDTLHFEMEYCTKLFKRETIERMGGHFVNVLRQLVTTPDMMLHTIDLLTEEEKKQILVDFNQTAATYPEIMIHQRFEQVAEKRPEAIAVVYGRDQLTYRQLNERANQVARLLQGQGVGPETIVGIMLDRSLELLIGILAIVKAGGAYLPIDPEYPADRMAFMLEDSGTEIVLTSREMMEKISFAKTRICLDDPTLYYGDGSNLETETQLDQLLYIIYTSGTTGKPKGAMITHRNVIRLMFNDKYLFDFTHTDIWTMFHSFAFDFSVWEMYGSLLYGGRLIVIPKAIARDPGQFLQLLKEEKVTVLNQTPSAFYNLVNEEIPCEDARLNLRYVIFGGEALHPGKLKSWRDKYPQTKLINMYGITETTVHVTFKEITEHEIQWNISNIGKPIPTLTTYVMDQNVTLLPIGVPGELCVGGEGVARGYLNRPELTAQKFVSNPHQPGERLYRSGDLVRFLENGDMEYFGRIDHQVKIRGFRIELGEIENKLLSHPMVREAVVLARTNAHGDKYLCGYLVPQGEVVIDELRKHLASDLPEYMIPSYFVKLEQIPLTNNGKVDRGALPEPTQEIETGVEYVPPRNSVEEALVAVWQDVLGVSRVGIKDNFFALGGDSIKAIQISARLQKYHLKLEIQKLFQFPTIAELSDWVQTVTKEIDQSPVEGNVPLTPIQKWFFAKEMTDAHHYNQSVMLHSSGGLDPDRVRQVFEKIVEHHDALRMVFTRNDIQVTPWNRGLSGEPAVDLSVMDLRQQVSDPRDEDYPLNLMAAKAAEIQSSIHLATGPLVRLGLFRTTEGDYLLIVIHHLVIDGVSWRILFEDFAAGYDQLTRGEEVHFPLKTTSYREWAERLAEYAESSHHLQEKEYWKRIEESASPALPRMAVGTANRKGDSQTATIRLTSEATHQLLKEAHQAYNTEINDLLMAALAMTVTQWTGSEKMLVNLEGHGREEILEGVDITRTIGWFTSVYPVMVDLERCTDLASVIKRTKETLRAIPAKGVGYGILKYLTPADLKSDMTFAVQPEMSFNYLGQFDQDVHTDLFTLAEVAKGQDQSSRGERFHALDFIGVVKEDAFELTVEYDAQAFDTQMMEQLLVQYREHLLAMIAHCIAQEETEYTLSDFTDELNEEEAENIFSELEDLFA